ncbi:MAG: basic amino acid ABC transporter substrate-binding protein [Candidatus Zixiibacteriota bacterium]
MSRPSHFIAVILSLLSATPILTGCGQKSERAQETSTLRIGTDATYPPFETVNTNTGKPDGFDIDLIKEICALNGWAPEFIVTPFDGMIPGLNGKKYDVAISAMTITPERAAQIDFSEPYYLAGQTIAVPESVTTIGGLPDLYGKKVGVQLGTTGEIMAKNTTGLEVFSFDNIGSAFIDMANGNLDAVLNDYPTTQAYIKSHGGSKMVGPILSKEQYGIAVRKGDAELLQEINHALTELKNSGKYSELHQKWFGSEPAEE